MVDQVRLICVSEQATMARAHGLTLSRAENGYAVLKIRDGLSVNQISLSMSCVKVLMQELQKLIDESESARRVLMEEQQKLLDESDY